MGFFTRMSERRVARALRQCAAAGSTAQQHNDERGALCAIHWRLQAGPLDKAARLALLDTIEKAMPELKPLRFGLREQSADECRPQNRQLFSGEPMKDFDNAQETPDAGNATQQAGSSDVQRLVMRHVHKLLDALDAEGIQPDEVHEYARHQAIEYHVRELYRALGREPVVPDE